MPDRPSRARSPRAPSDSATGPLHPFAAPPERGSRLRARTHARRRLPGLVYLLLSIFVFVIWTDRARTEAYEEADVRRHGWRTWNSVVEIASGRAPAPFVRRRLLADCGRLVAHVLPASTAAYVDEFTRSGTPPARALAAVLQRLNWAPEHYRLLFGAYLLIWLSILGFMYSCRYLVQILYATPPHVPDVLGGAFGLALLGGLGRWGSFSAYPYDLPHAFVFTLALAGMLARRWWFVPCFMLAAYSKETTLLLIGGYWLVSGNRRHVRFWIELGALTLIFAGVRAWIHVQYPASLPPGYDFWYPARSTRLLLESVVFYLWVLPILLLVAWKLVNFWSHLPPALSRLSIFIVILLVAGFFKAWVEERRQYLEVLPIAGLILAQWISAELGRGHLLVPRSDKAAGRESERGTPHRIP